jgi:glycosyltransferase involved in cell wall biosynthesis
MAYFEGISWERGDILKRTIEELSEILTNLLKDDGLRKRLSENAIEWAKRFSWDKSSEEFERVLEIVVKNG